MFPEENTVLLSVKHENCFIKTRITRSDVENQIKSLLLSHHHSTSALVSEILLMLNPKEDNTMSKTKVSDQEVKKKQPILCSASSTDVYNSRCYEASFC